MVAVLAKLLRAVWIGHWGGILAPRWVDIVHKKKKKKRISFFFFVEQPPDKPIILRL